jgi:hypothetical protein
MNVVQTLRECGVDFRTHGQSPHVTEGWLGVICPWCGKGTNKFGCGINLSRYNVSCFKCGSHSLASLLLELTQLPYNQIKDLVGGLSRPVPNGLEKRGRLVLPPGVGKLEGAHRDYLKRRGLDPDAAEGVWGVKGIGPVGRYKWRLFLPVTVDGEIGSWTTRAVSDEVGLRYVSAKPEQEKYRLKDMLFGEDLVPGHCVVINEGPLDAMAVGPGGVATCGLGYSRQQVLRLARFPVRVVATDNEPGARKRGRALCRALAAFDGETHFLEWSGKDASRSPKSEIEEVRRRFLT